MIEFKADCGHVIQAADRDAGQIVKCAYCGREVEAPRCDEQDPDILFQEVDLNELARGEGSVAGGAAMTIQGRQKKAKSAPSQEEIVQTGNRALRICLTVAFGAVCLAVMVVVTRSVVNVALNPAAPPRTEERRQLPLTSFDEPASRTGDALPQEQYPIPNRGSLAENAVEPTPSFEGRINYSFDLDQGIFVETFDKDARIYIREQNVEEEAALGTDELEFRGAGPTKILLPAGDYRVAVTLDAASRALTKLPGYDDLLSRLGFAGDNHAAEHFFAADASIDTKLVEEVDFEARLIREYEVEVRIDSWSLITNLFVPGDSVRAALSYLPAVTLYDFDHERARRELSTHGVPVEDLSFVVDMLARAGQVVWPVSESHSAVFEIDVRDGSFHTRELTVKDEVAPAAEPMQSRTAARPAPRRSPWERGRSRSSGAATTDRSAQQDLATVVQELGDLLSRDEVIEAGRWQPFLRGGSEFSVWQGADTKTRTAFVVLMQHDAAVDLFEQIGETMLSDPDLKVRLALLDALVLGHVSEAVAFVDRRLKAIEQDDTIDPAEAQREEDALFEARSQLTRKDEGKKKNPWER